MKKLLLILVLAVMWSSAVRANDASDGLREHQKGNYAEALVLFKTALVNGNEFERVTAQTMIGNMYRLGEGVVKDHKEALRWCRKAADQGHPSAQKCLGFVYRNGYGDHKEALKWFLLASGQGLADAEFEIGQYYYFGLGDGNPVDFKEAAKWFRLAAEQGLVKAQYNLGTMYKNGKGVIQNYKKAVKWWGKAAGMGHAKSQDALGMSYAAGYGITRDSKLAYMWLILAASNGYFSDSGMRDILAKHLTPVEVEKAQAMAIDCEEKLYRNCN